MLGSVTYETYYISGCDLYHMVRSNHYKRIPGCQDGYQLRQKQLQSELWSVTFVTKPSIVLTFNCLASMENNVDSNRCGYNTISISDGIDVPRRMTSIYIRQIDINFIHIHVCMCVRLYNTETVCLSTLSKNVLAYFSLQIDLNDFMPVVLHVNTVALADWMLVRKDRTCHWNLFRMWREIYSVLAHPNHTFGESLVFDKKTNAIN